MTEPRSRRHWTQTHDNTIRAGWSRLTPEQLADILNRSPKAVTNRARTLGLHGPDEQRTGHCAYTACTDPITDHDLGLCAHHHDNAITVIRARTAPATLQDRGLAYACIPYWPDGTSSWAPGDGWADERLAFLTGARNGREGPSEARRATNTPQAG